MTLVIRAASRADAPDIHAMIVAIAEHVDSSESVAATVEDIAAAGFGPTPLFDVLIAELDGAIVGMSLYFGSFSTWRGRRGGYVQDFYVAPEARGSEVAGSLLAATAAAVRHDGGTHLRLSVDAANESAQRFYTRQSMVPAEHERIFVLDGASFDTLASGG